MASSLKGVAVEVQEIATVSGTLSARFSGAGRPPTGFMRLRIVWKSTSMEKIILLCVIVGLIGLLAELSPVLSSQK